MRLSPDIRGVFNKLVKKGLAVNRIAELFDTTRQTVHRWLNRAKHVGREYFKDKPRKPKESKVTMEVELSILKLRTTLNGERHAYSKVYTVFQVLFWILFGAFKESSFPEKP